MEQSYALNVCNKTVVQTSFCFISLCSEIVKGSRITDIFCEFDLTFS